MQMDWLTSFGLLAVASMLTCYALEDCSAWFVLGFTGACALGSVYGFLQGAWPFGLVEAIWSLVFIASLAYQTCFQQIFHAAKWRCRHRSFQMMYGFCDHTGASTSSSCVRRRRVSRAATGPSIQSNDKTRPVG
jgi:hypothetical protein